MLILGLIKLLINESVNNFMHKISKNNPFLGGPKDSLQRL